MHVLHIYIIFFIFMLSCNESESETQAITESNCRASLTMPETTKSLLLSLEDDLINHYVNQIGRGVLLTGINSIDPLSKDDLNTVLLRIGTNISKSHDTTETQDLPYSEEYFLGCTSISNITFNIVEDNKFDMSSIINSFNESLKDTDIQSILPTPDKEATFLSQVIKSNIKGLDSIKTLGNEPLNTQHIKDTKDFVSTAFMLMFTDKTSQLQELSDNILLDLGYTLGLYTLGGILRSDWITEYSDLEEIILWTKESFNNSLNTISTSNSDVADDLKSGFLDGSTDALSTTSLSTKWINTEESNLDSLIVKINE